MLYFKMVDGDARLYSDPEGEVYCGRLYNVADYAVAGEHYTFFREDCTIVASLWGTEEIEVPEKCPTCGQELEED